MLFTEILIEYGMALGAALIFLVILPRWDRRIGSDSLAAWLIVSFVLQAMMWFAAVFTNCFMSTETDPSELTKD